MGKASKWLRGLFGLKKPDHSSAGAKPQKKKWGFVKSYREKDQPNSIPATVSDEEVQNPSMHALKLAEATAVVAEAAVAAAQAAAEVVRLTQSGNSNSTPSPSANNRVSRFGNVKGFSFSPASVNGGEYGLREDTAAITIQSYFRGYLSRRALRALRALVRLQAIVRGRIWRKRYTNELNHWKELLRAHNLVNAGRATIYESPHKGPATPEKLERMKSGENIMYKRNASQNKFRITASRSEESGIDHHHHQYQYQYQYQQPQMKHKPRNLFHSSHLSIGNGDQYSQNLEVQSNASPFKFPYYVEEEYPFWAAEKRGPLTPTRSDGSRSCLSGYSDCPSYMSYTESSKAKIRSLSAPRQRPAAAQQQYERSSSTTAARRLSIMHGYGQRVYPGSGRLDRGGMPVMAIREEGGVGFSGGLWHRF